MVNFVISIHAPREGRDCIIKASIELINDFNPRAPRGARRFCNGTITRIIHFNPRAPRGARHYIVPNEDIAKGISIHAPREGRDIFGRAGTSIPI